MAPFPRLGLVVSQRIYTYRAMLHLAVISYQRMRLFVILLHLATATNRYYVGGRFIA